MIGNAIRMIWQLNDRLNQWLWIFESWISEFEFRKPSKQTAMGRTIQRGKRMLTEDSVADLKKIADNNQLIEQSNWFQSDFQ